MAICFSSKCLCWNRGRVFEKQLGHSGDSITDGVNYTQKPATTFWGYNRSDIYNRTRNCTWTWPFWHPDPGLEPQELRKECPRFINHLVCETVTAAWTKTIQLCKIMLEGFFFLMIIKLISSLTIPHICVKYFSYSLFPPPPVSILPLPLPTPFMDGLKWLLIMWPI